MPKSAPDIVKVLYHFVVGGKLGESLKAKAERLKEKG
jgi:hypothetical protein